jgi:hypothetical protein
MVIRISGPLVRRAAVVALDLALFDRRDSRLVEENQGLLGPARRAWTAQQLKKYNLCLV